MVWLLDEGMRGYVNVTTSGGIESEEEVASEEVEGGDGGSCV